MSDFIITDEIFANILKQFSDTFPTSDTKEIKVFKTIYFLACETKNSFDEAISNFYLDMLKHFLGSIEKRGGKKPSKEFKEIMRHGSAEINSTMQQWEKEGFDVSFIPSEISKEKIHLSPDSQTLLTIICDNLFKEEIYTDAVFKTAQWHENESLIFQVNLPLYLLMSSAEPFTFTLNFKKYPTIVLAYVFNRKVDNQDLLGYLLNQKRYEFAYTVLKEVFSKKIYFEASYYDKAALKCGAVNKFCDTQLEDKYEKSQGFFRKKLSKLISDDDQNAIINFVRVWKGKQENSGQFPSYQRSFTSHIHRIFPEAQDPLMASQLDSLLNSCEVLASRYPFLISRPDNSTAVIDLPSLKKSTLVYNPKDVLQELLKYLPTFAWIQEIKPALEFSLPELTDKHLFRLTIKGDTEGITKFLGILKHPAFNMGLCFEVTYDQVQHLIGPRMQEVAYDHQRDSWRDSFQGKNVIRIRSTSNAVVSIEQGQEEDEIKQPTHHSDRKEELDEDEDKQPTAMLR